MLKFIILDNNQKINREIYRKVKLYNKTLIYKFTLKS